MTRAETRQFLRASNCWMPVLPMHKVAYNRNDFKKTRKYKPGKRG